MFKEILGQAHEGAGCTLSALVRLEINADISCESVPAGGGRVLKTLLCVHDQGGLVVVKVATPDYLQSCCPR